MASIKVLEASQPRGQITCYLLLEQGIEMVNSSIPRERIIEEALISSRMVVTHYMVIALRKFKTPSKIDSNGRWKRSTIPS